MKQGLEVVWISFSLSNSTRMRWISSLDTPKSTLSWPFIGVELKSGSIVPVGFVCFVFVIEVVLVHTVEFIGGDCVAIIECLK